MWTLNMNQRTDFDPAQYIIASDCYPEQNSICWSGKHIDSTQHKKPLANTPTADGCGGPMLAYHRLLNRPPGSTFRYGWHGHRYPRIDTTRTHQPQQHRLAAKKQSYVPYDHLWVVSLGSNVNTRSLVYVTPDRMEWFSRRWHVWDCCCKEHLHKWCRPQSPMCEPVSAR